MSAKNLKPKSKSSQIGTATSDYTRQEMYCAFLILAKRITAVAAICTPYNIDALIVSPLRQN